MRDTVRSDEMVIVGVALRAEGRLYFASKPYRYHHLVQMALLDGCKSPVDISGNNAGFISRTGTFFTRDEAEVVARAYGQLEGELKGSILTSEDLW